MVVCSFWVMLVRKLSGGVAGRLSPHRVVTYPKGVSEVLLGSCFPVRVLWSKLLT